MKTQLVAYWVTTALLVFSVLSGGIAELAQRPENIEGIVHQLGYPPYFPTIAGMAKVLGALVVLAPRVPRLKEWAYAGIFFNMTGAAASWAMLGGSMKHLIPTLFLAALTIASWALRPPSRVLGVLFPGTAPTEIPRPRV